jgi:5-methylcytosine-specific restriction endonuclease McrA
MIRHCSCHVTFFFGGGNLDKWGFHPAPKPHYTKNKRDTGATKKETVRQQVADRDGYHCLICGTSHRGLHLHRVVYGSQMGRYEINNCVLLCHKCHAHIHSNKSKYQPTLLNYLKDKGDLPT